MEGRLERVWVNGAFDVLHYGHLKLLEKARELGRVVVGIDSDRRVRDLKGDSRPYNNQDVRKYFLESLIFVDQVIIFDTEEELIDSIKNYAPDYMVIGSDYKDRRVIGGEYGGKIIFFDKLPEHSTTSILGYEKSFDNRG